MIYPRHDQDAQDVANHYDVLDKWYREGWGEHVHHGLWETGSETPELAVLKLVQRVAQEGGIGQGSRVVDIGCGYGGTSRMLVKGYGASVIGYTVSKMQYEYARAQTPVDTNPEYRLQDWYENELPDVSCDVALAIESSEHMGDKPKFFSETFRVLKPGGRFVVCAWLASENPQPREITYLLEPICFEGRLPSMGSETEYTAMLHDAGFVDVNFQDFTKRVSRTWLIVAWRFLKRLTWDSEARQHLRSGPNREFAMTVVRLYVAYKIGCLRYGMFSCTRPGL